MEKLREMSARDVYDSEMSIAMREI